MSMMQINLLIYSSVSKRILSILTELKRKIRLFLFLLISLCSCISNELEHSLIISGTNRTELEKVLEHYKGKDMLKYKAACYLIENMQYHFSTKLVESYDPLIDTLAFRADSIYYSLVSELPDSLLSTKSLMDSLRVRDTPFREMVQSLVFKQPVVRTEFVNDLQRLDAGFLIAHIDHAFLQWEQSSLCRALDFETFCEYLLPYRSLQYYPIAESGADLARLLSKYVTTAEEVSLTTAIERYNTAVSRLHWFMGQYPFDDYIGMKELFFRGFHDCVEIAHYGTVGLRACGVPVAIEFNSAYRSLEGRHFHCSVLDSLGRSLTFSPESETPVLRNKKFADDGVMNIYRQTFAAQHSAPFFIRNRDEFVPEPLNSPCIVDVSAEIVNTVEISLDCRIPSDNRLVYLATFSREANGLIPVTWAKVNRLRKQAVFKTVIPDRIYFPVYYQGSEPVSFGNAFMVRPDSTNRKGYTLEEYGVNEKLIEFPISLLRKYPQKPTMKKVADDLVGCVVLGSNDAKFATCDTLAILSKPPVPYYQDLELNNTTPYRFYRIKTTDQSPHANFSEVEFLTKRKYGYPNITTATPLPLSGLQSSISSNGALVRLLDDSLNNISWKAEYDKNVETAPSAYPTIDFKLPAAQVVTCVRFVPRNANNGIEPGNVYVLRSWKAGRWAEEIRVKAQNHQIRLKGLKTNRLYWLQNITKGKEEMPFVIDQEGRQRFVYLDSW